MGHNGRWEDNIKMHAKIMVLENVNLIHVAQNRISLRDFVNTEMNLRVTQNAGQFLTNRGVSKFLCFIVHKLGRVLM